MKELVRGKFFTIRLESYFFSFVLPTNGKIKIQKNVVACFLYRCK